MTSYNLISIQFKPKFGKVEKNIEIMKNLVENNIDLNPDLIVFPEFCEMGITFQNPKDFAVTEKTSPAIKLFKKLAKTYNTYISTGSIIEKDGEKIYNTTYMIDRNGEIVAKYRKRHLYNYFGGTEGLVLSEGNEMQIVDTDIGKIGMSICFDIRFAYNYREMMKKGAEIFVCSAAWCMPYLDLWKNMNKSRAADNGCFMISSTLTGEQAKGLSLCGNSMIVNPQGDIMSNAGIEDGIAFAKIDMDNFQKFRKEFPVVEIF